MFSVQKIFFFTVKDWFFLNEAFGLSSWENMKYMSSIHKYRLMPFKFLKFQSDIKHKQIWRYAVEERDFLYLGQCTQYLSGLYYGNSARHCCCYLLFYCISHSLLSIFWQLCSAGRQTAFRKACILNSTTKEINIQAGNMGRKIAYRKLNLLAQFYVTHMRGKTWVLTSVFQKCSVFSKYSK